MYKIYINDNLMILAGEDEIHNKVSTKTSLIAPYTGKTKMLLSYIDMLEKTDRFDKIVLYSSRPKKLVKDLESLYTVIKAAGGAVKDESGKILMIFRRGHWDLPKGKLDKGEKKKAAAVREVEEETGINGIVLQSKILTTRHAYKLKNGQRALKKTYWYNMEAPHQKLTPQLDEDILKAEWHDLEDGYDYDEPIFKNISDVLNQIGVHKKY